MYDSSITIRDNTNDPNIYSAITDISVSNYTPPDFCVDKGIIVRAVAIDNNNFSSNVITKSYFVNKKSEYYNDMAVISLTTDSENLFSDDTGIYVLGSNYYKWFKKNGYKYSNKNNVAYPTNYNKSGREYERKSYLHYFENGELKYETGCGIRIAGSFSRGYSQKSFRLYSRGEYGNSKFEFNLFDKLTDEYGNPINSFDKLLVHSGGNDCKVTKIKNILISKCVKNRNVSAIEYRPCVLFLNGEFWGMYFLGEVQNSSFIQSHYGVKEDNVTIVKNAALDEGDNNLLEDYKKFYSWAIKSDMTIDSNYQKFCDTIDVQSFIDYFATETYVNNTDWSIKDSANMNNWMMWRSNSIDENSEYSDGKWRFMLFDVDLTSDSYTHNSLENMSSERKWNITSSLFYKVMENQEFKQRFYDSYTEIIEENFNSEKVCALIDELSGTCGEATKDTFRRYSLNVDYDNKIKTLKKFYNSRPVYAAKYLNEFCGIDPENMKLTSCGLSLGDNIGVKFCMELSQSVIEDSGAYMQFVLPNGLTEKVPLSDAAKVNMDNKEYYVFTCKVAAKEMTSEIKAQMRLSIQEMLNW